METRRTFARCAAALAAAAALPAAFAQSFPDKPIRFIVGLPPGSTGDLTSRIIAAKASEMLKQSVYVENRVGAAGIISHEVGKAAPPDGYTLLFSAAAMFAINPALYSKLPYNALRDFEPVTGLINTPQFLYTSSSSPVNNVQELIAYVKANPGKVSYASSGNGQTSHLAMEMLKKAAQIDMVHVPYKSASAVTTDILGGQVQFAFDSAPSILPHARSGKVKLLGVSSLERLAAAPNVPTIAEQGIPGFLAMAPAVLLVPKGTPADVIKVLNAAFVRAMNDRGVQDDLAKGGAITLAGSPDDTRKFMQTEIARWGAVVKESGAQVD